MFRTTFAFAAIAGIAAAQQGYGYGSSSSSATGPVNADPTGVPDASTCACYAKLSVCQTAPNANQAYCASQFAGCLGYNPYNSNAATTAFFNNLEKYCTSSSSMATAYATSTPPSYTTAAASTATYGPPSQATCACYAKLGECQTAPNANQAYCASQFSECVNFNPYTGGEATTNYFNNLKKYCSASTSTPISYSASSTTCTTTTGSASTTSSASTTEESCACYSKLSACQTAPNANEAYCASQFASCLNYNPYTGTTAQETAFFDNLKKTCASGSSSAPSSYSTPASSAHVSVMTPPVYSTSTLVAYTSNGSVMSATQTTPALYTGAAAAKTMAPVAAILGFGALLL